MKEFDAETINLLTIFIVESNLIEGIKVDPVLIRNELMSGEKSGHAGAMLFLQKLAKNKKHILTEADVKKVQELITKEQGEKGLDRPLKSKWVGEYRDIGVMVGGKICPHYSQVPSLMKNLILQIQEWQKRWEIFEKIENIAFLDDSHLDFEKIHPFADGNGRTGRALILYLMLYMDIKPFIFTNYDKFLCYYPPLQKEDKKIMRQYFYQKSKIAP